MALGSASTIDYDWNRDGLPAWPGSRKRTRNSFEGVNEMPVNITGFSDKNSVRGDASRLTGEIHFEGAGSSVTFGRKCVSGSIRMWIGQNVHVQIGDNCVLGHLEIHAAGSNRVNIGDRTGFNGRVRLLMHEAGDITIGVNCLIGQSDFTISDMHSIVDIVSGRRTNPAASISLADHVRIGEGALLLKGVKIGAHSVIGARAVVTQGVPPQSVAAGIPARVIRSGVTWRHDLV